MEAICHHLQDLTQDSDEVSRIELISHILDFLYIAKDILE